MKIYEIIKASSLFFKEPSLPNCFVETFSFGDSNNAFSSDYIISGNIDKLQHMKADAVMLYVSNCLFVYCSLKPIINNCIPEFFQYLLYVFSLKYSAFFQCYSKMTKIETLDRHYTRKSEQYIWCCLLHDVILHMSI